MRVEAIREPEQRPLHPPPIPPPPRPQRRHLPTLALITLITSSLSLSLFLIRLTPPTNNRHLIPPLFNSIMFPVPNTIVRAGIQALFVVAAGVVVDFGDTHSGVVVVFVGGGFGWLVGGLVGRKG